MMYSEFIEGTGCKENEHNYKVFRNLEAMYMNTDMTKAEIYEYGKKLVDNSKSEAELKIEADCKAEIESLKAEIEYRNSEIAYRSDMLKMWEEDGDKEWIKITKNAIKWEREQIRIAKGKIKGLKWVLA